MAITQDESKLVAIFVQSCLWGAFCVMFILTCWTLLYRRPMGATLNKPMLGVAVLMFILATMQLGINFTRITRGFVTFNDTQEVYWNQLSEFTQVWGSSMYIAQTFVGDGVALYRCYIVWGRRAIHALLPGMIYTGSLVSGIGILIIMGKTTDADVFAERLQKWISCFFAFTLATSTVCTAMIASRIWYLSRVYLSGRSSRRFEVAMRVIIESGAIYSAMLVALLALYGLKSWFQYVIVDALSSTIGIVFSVIIVRIGLGIAVESDTVQMSDGVVDSMQRMTREYPSSEQHWKYYSNKSHSANSQGGRRCFCAGVMSKAFC